MRVGRLCGGDQGTISALPILCLSFPVLSGVFTDVEASLKEIRDLLEEDEAQERKLQELLGKSPAPPGSPPPPSPGLAEVSKECSKYLEVHEKASFTNTELHKAMNLHIGNLRLLSGPLEQVRAALPSPSLTEGEFGAPLASSSCPKVGRGTGSAPPWCVFWVLFDISHALGASAWCKAGCGGFFFPQNAQIVILEP